MRTNLIDRCHDLLLAESIGGKAGVAYVDGGQAGAREAVRLRLAAVLLPGIPLEAVAAADLRKRTCGCERAHIYDCCMSV